MSRSTLPAGRRIGTRQLVRLQGELSPRDWAVLRSVADCRYLGARQIERWHFPASPHGAHTPLSAARSCRRVLERLTRLGVLARLERRIGGVRAGSAGFVYAPGRIGRRLLSGEGRAMAEPSRHFLDHCLAAAELVVELVEAARAGALQLIGVETEPVCWRRYLGTQGARATLKPDLFVVAASGEIEYHWFVEVDRGSEHRPALRRKAQAYRDYFRSGREQARTGLFPRVLWVVPDEPRAEVVADALAIADLPPGLFTVVPTAEALRTLAGRGDDR